MPTCSARRIDHLDFNIGPHDISRLVTDGADTIWVFYSAQTVAGSALSKRCFVRKYTISTDTMGPVVQFDDNEIQGATFPSAVRLFDGRLISTYKWQIAASGTTSAGIKAKESIDGGLTWSTAAELTTGTPSPQLLKPYGIDTASTGRTMLISQHIAGPGDTYTFKRLGVGSWGGGTQAFNGTGTEVWAFTSASARNFHAVDDNKACFLATRVTGGHTKTLRGMYSVTDGGTWTETADVYTVATDVLDFGLKSMRGSDSRIRAQWVDSIVSPNKMYLGYSDDQGATWTNIGSPPGLDGYGWDPDYPHALALDSQNKWFLSATFFADPHSIPYRVFKGNDDLTSWELVLECTLSLPFRQLTTAGVGESIFVGSDHFYVGSYGTTGPSVYHLMLIKVAGIGYQTAPPPCSVNGSLNVCPGASTQLCGPSGNGLTYYWTFPDGTHATQQCIAANQYGTYNLTVTDSATGLATSCSGVVVQPSDCPQSSIGPSVNRIFRKGVIKVISSDAPQPNFTVAPMERLDRPQYGGS